jgi:hypothetical protein
MDIDKLNSRKLKAALYLIPLIMMLAASMDYIIEICHDLPLSASLIAVLYHCLFLISLSAVCANLTTEIYLSLLQGGSKSGIEEILYGGSRFFPTRAAVFVVIFIICDILLSQIIAYQSSIESLMLLIPPIAIFINARHFLSGRLRNIGGVYIIFNDTFKAMFSYFIDDAGFLCLISDDGLTISSGVNTTDIDFEKLEAEFAKNNFKRGDHTNYN